MRLGTPSHLAYHQHIGIGPIARTLESGPAVLPAKADLEDALPRVAYVSGGAPALSIIAQIRPKHHPGRIGDGVNDIAPGSEQCCAHILQPPDVVDVPIVL